MSFTLKENFYKINLLWFGLKNVEKGQQNKPFIKRFKITFGEIIRDDILILAVCRYTHKELCFYQT